MLKRFKNSTLSITAASTLLLLSQSAFAVDAPNPSVQEATIIWAPVNAKSINVHRGNGDWLATIPGNSTNWKPTESGDYFLVATDIGPWQTWGKSVQVSVDANDRSGPPAIDQSIIPMNPENFRVSVYSPTALELFWDHASDRESAAVAYFVKQNGEYIAEWQTGSSLFIDGLTPNQQNVFELEAVAFALNSSDFVSLTVFPDGSVSPVTVSSTAYETPAANASTNTGTSNSGTSSGAANETASGSSTSQPLNDQPANGGSVSAPIDVAASAYSETSGEVFWGRSSSPNDLPIEYEVVVNDEPVARTSGASFYFDDLISGTDYSIRIDAIAGSARSSSDVVTMTTFGAIRANPVGRPAFDASTHGFGYWDNMTFEQQQRWPSDCLFGGGQTSSIENGRTPQVCFSPFRRELIAPRFRFALPGDNATNHVEAIEWVNAGWIALVTDITTEFSQSKFEISLFEQAGHFDHTTPILESVTNRSGTTQGINLDGSDIKVIRDGSTRSNPASFFIYVIGEYYEPNGDNNRSALNGWDNLGSFAAKIDTSDGTMLSLTYFPERSQESITRDDLTDFFGS